jgi:diguanylate cyclase (GGDEF)-like protein
MVGSFKLRLVLYFVLLSLVPVAGVTWAFSAAASRNELQRADESLGKTVRAAVGQLDLELDQAAAQAESLARSPEVQQALQKRDRAALAEAAGEAPGSSFSAGGTVLAGSVPPLAASRSANVVDGTRLIGRVTVSIPLDEALLERMSFHSGIDSDELLVLAVDGRIIGQSDLSGSAIPPLVGHPEDIDLGADVYRAIGTPLLADGSSVALLALTPRSAIDSNVTDVNLRLILAALGSIAVVAAVSFLPGRAIVGALREIGAAAAGIAEGRLSERVPLRGKDEFAQLGRAFNDMASQLEARQEDLRRERERVRRALERLGAALTASNEPDVLLAIVAESAVEATGAAGARILQSGAEIARAGEPDRGGDPVTLLLGSPEAGQTETLLLFPKPGTDFGEDALAAARSLATQAAVGFENARLHRIVSQQAVTDELTQLANRRRFDEELDHEVGRIRRFGGSLSLIIADIDDFKAINDRHGHPLGDEVLRAFADVIRETVRSVDLPARPGGEEFAVILPGTDVDEACIVAERLRARLAGREIPVPRTAPIRVTASFGVASLAESMSADELFAVADAALYEAKAHGKNCVVASRSSFAKPAP